MYEAYTQKRFQPRRLIKYPKQLSKEATDSRCSALIQTGFQRVGFPPRCGAAAEPPFAIEQPGEGEIARNAITESLPEQKNPHPTEQKNPRPTPPFPSLRKSHSAVKIGVFDRGERAKFVATPGSSHSPISCPGAHPHGWMMSLDLASSFCVECRRGRGMKICRGKRDALHPFVPAAVE